MLAQLFATVFWMSITATIVAVVLNVILPKNKKE